MIGILKAIGTSNKSITQLFIYNASYIIINGLIWGNILGLGICVIQHFTGFIKMNQENYYLSEAPVNFDIWSILLINIGTLAICTIIMLLPTRLISRISPIKAIRFE